MLNNRRDILKALGMTAAAGVVSTEAVAASSEGSSVGKPYPSYAARAEKTQEAIAESLENMARNIRAGTLTALGFDVHSSFRHDDFLQHEIKFLVETTGEHES